MVPKLCWSLLWNLCQMNVILTILGPTSFIECTKWPTWPCWIFTNFNKRKWCSSNVFKSSTYEWRTKTNVASVNFNIFDIKTNMKVPIYHNTLVAIYVHTSQWEQWYLYTCHWTSYSQTSFQKFPKLYVDWKLESSLTTWLA